MITVMAQYLSASSEIFPTTAELDSIGIVQKSSEPQPQPASPSFLPVTGIPHLFYSTLNNNLDVFFLEDYSSPSAAFCLAVKAGTSIQTPGTTGFPELYARLFFSPAGGQKIFYENGAFSVSSECSGDYALYSAIFSADSINKMISLLAECTTTGFFPEAELKTQYEAMLTKAAEWDNSLENYINGSMDARLFSEYPWKRETGLCPDVLKSYGTDGAATILKDIQQTFYVPDNSALFIYGPFSPDYILSLTENLLSCWNTDEPLSKEVAHGLNNDHEKTGEFSDELLSKQSTANLDAISNPDFSEKRNGGGRYVLTSSSFSKDFNQLIIQYVLPENFPTAAETAATETAVSIFQNGNAFKNLVISNETCGVKSADWLYTSFSRQQSGTRLIFQALMENGNFSPSSQALAFSSCIENDSIFTADEVSYYSRITADRISLLRKEPFTLIHAMAEDWAFCNPVFPKSTRSYEEESFPDFSLSHEYAEAFTAAYEKAALTLTSEELFHVMDGEPYIFLLLNDSVYKKYKKNLENDGFTLISTDNGIWYKMAEYEDVLKTAKTASNSTISSDLILQNTVDAKNSNSMRISSDLSANSALETQDGIFNFVMHGKNGTELNILSNGIPVLSYNNTTSSFSFQIRFSGKTAGLTASQRDIRTVISDVITNNIKQYLLLSGIPYTSFSVVSQNSLYDTSITVNTTSEYAEAVIGITAEALFFGEISAPRVDECAYSRSSEWNMKRTDGDLQLHNAALARLYKGTTGAEYFDLSKDFLADVTFQDIEIEYLDMLDASCISLALVGENAADFVPFTENIFGFLMNFSTSCRDSAVSSPAETFPNDSVSVSFRRIFTSSVKPGEYLVQPPKLIPTEIFYDPLHIYFECPAYGTPEYAVFASLVYELEEILDEMWDGGALASFDMLYVPVAGIWFHEVTKAADVYDVFAKGIEKLQEPFDEPRLQKIRNRFVERFCSELDMSPVHAELLLESRFYSGNKQSDKTASGEATNREASAESEIATYLTQLEQLKNATPQDFAKAAARFSTMATLRAVSADTK